jgi:hypothetical protein
MNPHVGTHVVKKPHVGNYDHESQLDNHPSAIINVLIISFPVFVKSVLYLFRCNRNALLPHSLTPLCCFFLVSSLGLTCFSAKHITDLRFTKPSGIALNIFSRFLIHATPIYVVYMLSLQNKLCDKLSNNGGLHVRYPTIFFTTYRKVESVVGNRAAFTCSITR